MLNSFPITVLIGTLLGFLAGLGVGGGTLLILWLTVILNQDPATARLINLLFFVASSVSVSLIRIKSQSIPWKKIIPAIAAGCIMAGIVSGFIDFSKTDGLKRLFGILLIITGIRELFYRPRKAK